MAWTTPTIRSTGYFVTASIWNTELIGNLAYLKDAPTFDGAVTVTGLLTTNGALRAKGAIAAHVASSTGLDHDGTAASSWWTWGNDASTLGSFAWKTRSSNGSLGSTIMTLTGAGLLTLAGNSATYGLEANGSNGLGIAATNASGDIRFYVGGTTLSASLVGITSTLGYKFAVGPAAVGTGAKGGCYVYCGRNSSGNGAAGLLVLVPRDNSGPYYLWTDTSGNLRIQSGTFPTEDNSVTDTSGTIVGTQSSTRASKVIEREFRDTKRALTTLLKTPLFQFRYKSGAYSNQQFVGITTDDSPEFGMDDGKSFNPVSAFGFTVAAIQEIARRLDRIEEAMA